MELKKKNKELIKKEQTKKQYEPELEKVSKLASIVA